MIRGGYDWSFLQDSQYYTLSSLYTKYIPIYGDHYYGYTNDIQTAMHITFTGDSYLFSVIITSIF